MWPCTCLIKDDRKSLVVPDTLTAKLETILVVDDNDAVLEAVAGILRHANFQVLSAGNGEDGAIAANGDGTTSLVLLVSPDTAERLAYAAAYADLAVSVAPAGEA